MHKKPDTITVDSYKLVSTFLSSIQRNSVKSKKVYNYGLVHFEKFLSDKYPQQNIETILKPLISNEINVYSILDEFVAHLITMHIATRSIQTYIAAVRSYLEFYDINIISSKFKRRVKMPKMYREDEEPLDAADIRKILLACNNRRLKPYLLILASGGLRANEALSLRIKDLDFSVNPTKIHVRKEYAKTRVSRDVYISDEATHYLKEWLAWKYKKNKQQNDDDTIFTVYKSAGFQVDNIYVKVMGEFQKVLKIVGLDQRKEGIGKQKRMITFHSFRRFCKSVISNQVNSDYSEWFLGHNKSPYYTIKEAERRVIYAQKCMSYLTFLDYTTLEATGKNIEAKLQEKDIQIQKIMAEQHIKEDKLQTIEKQMQAMQTTQKELKLLLKNPRRLVEILDRERSKAK